MDLTHIINSVRYLIKNINPVILEGITITDINLGLETVHHSMFRDYSRIIDTDNTAGSIMEPFKREAQITLLSGIFALPSGFYKVLSARTSNDVPIDELTMAEVTEQLGDAILAPTTSYPVFYVIDGDLHFYPETGLGIIELIYLVNPGAPNVKLTEDSTHGFYYIDDGTTSNLWRESEHPEIVQRLTGYFGVDVTKEQARGAANATL